MSGQRAAPARWSLRTRLLVSAAVFVGIAILALGLVINGLLERFVRGEVAGRLDLQIAAVEAVLVNPGRAPPPAEPRRGRREDGPRDLDAPPFGRARDGWYWQASTSEGVVLAASRSLGDRQLPAIDGERGRRGPPDRLIDMEGPTGEPLVARVRDVPGPGRPIRILATAPAEAVRGPLRGAALTVTVTLILLGVGLAGAIVAQVRLALGPVDALRRSLGAVREGRSERIDAPQPRELQPLADELNALLAHDAEILRQARLHVANLAHGLKTPLATLAAQAARQPDTRARAEWEALTELMDRRIRHHLRRARSAARGGPARHRTPLRAHVDDLAAMLTRFNNGPPCAIEIQISPDLHVAVDAEDLDEMIGNLLENACRHATTRVVVAATREGRDVRVSVGDDGAGLTSEEIGCVLQPGTRLDEALPGHGFGLPITAEIAHLYGGSLELGRSPLGGLEAVLRLPSPVSTS